MREGRKKKRGKEGRIVNCLLFQFIHSAKITHDHHKPAPMLGAGDKKLNDS